MKSSPAQRHSPEGGIEIEIGHFEREVVRVVAMPATPLAPPVEPMTDAELRSIAFADADGWRCFYPASRGHLTAAEARAVMRKERGLPAETAAEAEAAEFLLAVEIGWAGGDSPA